jgi:5-formyltetrahydrofolate cyclo-ligase
MLLDDDELVERLPAEPHDHLVTAALVPKAGLITLGKTDRP